MELVFGLVCGLASVGLFLLVLVLFESWLLRAAIAAVAGVSCDTARSVVTVVMAGLFQSLAMGVVGGADAGLCGTIAGWVVWCGVVSLLAQVRFGQAVVVGLLMAVVHWVIGLLLAGFVLVTGLGALGAAALFG